MRKGSKVVIAVNRGPHTCWPEGRITGEVRKVFKNGMVSVAVDQLPARRVQYFPPCELTVLEG